MDLSKKSFQGEASEDAVELKPMSKWTFAEKYRSPERSSCGLYVS